MQSVTSKAARASKTMFGLRTPLGVLRGVHKAI